MSQSHLRWSERKKFGKGEVSQEQFRLWAERNGIKYLPFGFDLTDEQDKDISIARFLKLTPQVRMTPDYACMSKKAGFLVEVKGCGRDGVKIKEETLQSLSIWQEHMQDVYFFIYNSHTHACVLITYAAISQLCYGWASPKYFESDNKKYYLLPNDKFTWETIEKERT